MESWHSACTRSTFSFASQKYKILRGCYSMIIRSDGVADNQGETSLGNQVRDVWGAFTNVCWFYIGFTWFWVFLFYKWREGMDPRYKPIPGYGSTRTWLRRAFRTIWKHVQTTIRMVHIFVLCLVVYLSTACVERHFFVLFRGWLFQGWVLTKKNHPRK